MFNESYESLLKANLQIKMADKINSMGIINLESFWVDVFGVKDFEEFFKKDEQTAKKVNSLDNEVFAFNKKES